MAWQAGLTAEAPWLRHLATSNPDFQAIGSWAGWQIAVPGLREMRSPGTADPN